MAPTPTPMPTSTPTPIDVDDCFAPDCPYVAALAAAMRDDDIAEAMLPVAVNGTDELGFETYGATYSTIAITGTWSLISNDGAHVRVGIEVEKLGADLRHQLVAQRIERGGTVQPD